MSTFSSLGVPADLLTRLKDRGFTDAFPIQAAVMPGALAGNDICGRAPTGSGKTLAFGIPLLARVGRASPRAPQALVLAPTRELAAQIAEELKFFGAARRVRVASFYGGTGYGSQLEALRRGVDIVVACPGRLADLLERRALSLSEVAIVVVDEADRMADMGFLPEVRRLLDQVRADRQTMLFSATLDGDVQALIARYQRNPEVHELTQEKQASGEQHHQFLRTESSERGAVTARIVAEHDSTIVFCRTKRGADRLTRQLAAAGVSVVALHGDRTQAQRDRALALFRDQRVSVLVGTDVAARGIDVAGVSCVVHFDPPEDEKAYVHRSGRTARAGRSGTVISLITAEHTNFARQMERRLGLESSFGAEEAFPRKSASKQRPRRSGGFPQTNRGSVAKPGSGASAKPKAALTFQHGGASQRDGAGARTSSHQSGSNDNVRSMPRRSRESARRRQRPA